MVTARIAFTFPSFASSRSDSMSTGVALPVFPSSWHGFATKVQLTGRAGASLLKKKKASL